jgi:hypothetical protein
MEYIIENKIWKANIDIIPTTLDFYEFNMVNLCHMGFKRWDEWTKVEQTCKKRL